MAVARRYGAGETSSRRNFVLAHSLGCSLALRLAAEWGTNGVSVGLITALMSLKDTIDRDLSKHSRENEVVYMVRVPAYENLPELGAAAMVRPAPPPPESLDAAGETLFSAIVPESGFKALSKYTELVDATIREETDVLALASDEARAALAEMELPELLIAAEAGAASAVPGGARDADAGAGAGLPAPLAEELAAAQRAGVSAGLRADVARLREAHDACAQRVDATERALDAEATEDEACRGAYGADKWTRPPSAALAKNLREKLPPLIRAVQAQGRAALWVSDPVHGNGYTSENGFKTRNFDDIRAEIDAFFDVHAQLGRYEAMLL